MAAQPRKGLDQLAEGARLIETTHERWIEAEMHRLRGSLLLLMHDHAAAESSYGRALEVARQQSAKFWEFRTALDLARLWRDKGKRTDARGLDKRDLTEARALLDELA